MTRYVQPKEEAPQRQHVAVMCATLDRLLHRMAVAQSVADANAVRGMAELCVLPPICERHTIARHHRLPEALPTPTHPRPAHHRLASP